MASDFEPPAPGYWKTNTGIVFRVEYTIRSPRTGRRTVMAYRRERYGWHRMGIGQGVWARMRDKFAIYYCGADVEPRTTESALELIDRVKARRAIKPR